ncbi:hypothetical protein SNE40_009940 [Patella caerulea]|uniref:Uncharacterized protein n=1 Tax=Patella caerulea TaxID=87958 RepID=A0AAN8JWR8_PATCE
MSLPNKVLKRISPSSVLVCVKSCLLNSQCLSINFDRTLLVCELNAGEGDTATLVATTGVMHSKRSNWNANASDYGECATIKCSNGTTCLNISGIVKCIKKVPYCGEPVRIENSTISLPDSGQLGAMRSYTCRGRTISDSPMTSTCLSDGTWSIPVVRCRHIESCIDVQKCSSTDGEYWVYPSAVENKPVKIYCDGMSTTTPKEFLTMVNENKAFYAFKQQKNGVSRCSSVETRTWPASGTTTYQKVRINTKVCKYDFIL